MTAPRLSQEQSVTVSIHHCLDLLGGPAALPGEHEVDVDVRERGVDVASAVDVQPLAQRSFGPGAEDPASVAVTPGPALVDHLRQLGLGPSGLTDHHNRVRTVLEEAPVEGQQYGELLAGVALGGLQAAQHPGYVRVVVQRVQQPHRQAGLVAVHGEHRRLGDPGLGRHVADARRRPPSFEEEPPRGDSDGPPRLVRLGTPLRRVVRTALARFAEWLYIH